MRLTKQAVERLPSPEQGQAFYFDDELPSFGVRVSAGGTRAYILDRRIAGKRRRITIARSNQMAPDKARNLARKMIGDIIDGGDPVADKQRERLKGVTLKDALEDYIAARDLKPRTVADMRIVMERGLSGWMTKPITSITADMVLRKHRELGATSQAQANLAMKYLRAVLALAQLEYRDGEGKPILESNPVGELSRRKAWHRVERRRTLIKTHQFPSWYAAVLTLPVNVQNYILYVLFTGLRAGEAATLKWDTVDLNAGAFTVLDTKNRTAHELPLSDYLRAMLEAQRKRVAGEYVFPGLHGKGHIKSAQSAIRKVEAASGVEFCLHDLRRTFATVAESLDIPAYAVKRLLNHTMAGDVTAGYVVTDVERLRRPMQKVTDFLLSACGAKAGAEVVELRHAQA